MPRYRYGQRPEPAHIDGYFQPSSPVPVPGNPDSWDFIDVLQSVRVMSKNPLEATTQISLDELTYQAKVAGTQMTVTSDPEIIHYLFVEKSAHLDLHPIRQAILKPALGEGLITTQGAKWKRARHLLSPVFRPKHIGVFAQTMETTTQTVVPELFGDGGEVLLSQKMLSLAYQVLSDALFSGEIEDNMDEVLGDIADLLAHMGRPNALDVFGAPKWIPRLNQVLGSGPVRRVRAMISKATERRKAQRDAGRDLPDDFLTLLLSAGDAEQSPLSDLEIENEMITFIGAGHETTSRAMSWMLYLLSQDEKSRARLEAEVDALDMSRPASEWAEALPFGMACFEETMRLFPPAPFISRTLNTEEGFGEYTFKKGGALMINLWSLHRHETLWARPNLFDPLRFYGEARKEIGRFQYLPFGLGHRVCIGQRFALQEAAILIAHLVSNYRFDYIGETPPWPVMRVTIQADNQMPMRVTKRK